MTYFESLDFVYRLVFERFDLLVWGVAILTFLLSIIFIHWLWGLGWNSHWSLFKRPSFSIFSFILAFIIGFSALIWLAADRSHEWLQQQRTELTRQFTDSGRRNRSVFTAACERIGQGCDPSSNSMILKNQLDLQILTEIAAASVECPLTPSGPLGSGSPCRVRDTASVAQDVIRLIRPAAFPLTVSPDNQWTKSAVNIQIQEALSYATPKLRKGMDELQTLMAWLFLSALAIQLLIVQVAAVSDIRIHPKF